MEAEHHTLLTPRGVTWLGLGVNVGLAGAKVAAGLLFGSQTILADGLHSASDMVSDVAVLAGLRVSAKPADGCHHYGHRRVSTLVAMIVGAMLLLAAGYILYEAIHSLRQFRPPTGSFGMPLVLALVSIPLKEALFRLTRRVGRREKDASLVANAWHHRSDAVTSVAASAGLGAAMIGGGDWALLDPLTAAVLSAFLAVTAVRILRKSASELVDSAPSDERLACIKRIVAQTPGVRGYHAFRARQVGGQVAMDVHIFVDPELTVCEGHEIAGAVKHGVLDSDCDVVETVVHVEPYEPPGR